MIKKARSAELSIPDGVTTIGNMAFRYNSKLARLEVPASVTSIEEGALANIGKADLYFKGSSAPACDTNAFYGNSTETIVHHSFHATGFGGDVWRDMTVVGPDISQADVSLAYTSATYSGKPLEPSVSATYEGEALSAGTDFEVTYENNVASGQAKAIVKGIGRMSGTRTLTFDILPIQLDNNTKRAAREKAVRAKAPTFVILNSKTVDAKSLKKASKKVGVKLSKVKTVTLGGKVRTLKKGALKGCGAKTLVVKTTKLTKKSVKGSLKGSKVKAVKVQVGSKKLNGKYAKSYKKLFAKKSCGKKVAVEAA